MPSLLPAVLRNARRDIDFSVADIGEGDVGYTPAANRGEVDSMSFKVRGVEGT